MITEKFTEKFTEKQFRKEYKRCDRCTASFCQAHCPANISIPETLQFYEYSDKHAQEYLYKINPFQEVCGYICPDRFCADSCIKNTKDGYPVNAKLIHRYFGQNYEPDYESLIINDYPDKSVIVIGAGVTGLTVAWKLANLGVKVEVIESTYNIGGKLNLIPEFRLPRDVLDRTLSIIKNHPNITISTNVAVLDIDAFIGTNPEETIIPCIGNRYSKKLNIEGEENTIDYRDYLPSPKVSEKDVVGIIGGGNVAVDCALVSAKGGAKVHMIIRRNFGDMKIDPKYLQGLYSNGVNIITNFKPSKIDMGFDTMNIDGTLLNEKITLKGFTKIVKAIGDIDAENSPKTVVECVKSANDKINALLSIW